MSRNQQLGGVCALGCRKLLLTPFPCNVMLYEYCKNEYSYALKKENSFIYEAI